MAIFGFGVRLLQKMHENQVRMSKQVRIPEAFTPDTGKNFFLHNGHFRFWGKTFAKVCTKNQVRMSKQVRIAEACTDAGACTS